MRAEDKQKEADDVEKGAREEVAESEKDSTVDDTEKDTPRRSIEQEKTETEEDGTVRPTTAESKMKEFP